MNFTDCVLAAARGGFFKKVKKGVKKAAKKAGKGIKKAATKVGKTVVKGAKVAWKCLS